MFNNFVRPDDGVSIHFGRKYLGEKACGFHLKVTKYITFFITVMGLNITAGIASVVVTGATTNAAFTLAPNNILSGITAVNTGTSIVGVTKIDFMTFNTTTTGLSNLTDGIAGAPDGFPNTDYYNSVQIYNGTVLTYNLPSATQLNRIDVYSGWSDNGRVDQNNVTVNYSTDGTNFVNLTTYSLTYSQAGGVNSSACAMDATLTGFNLDNVTALQFSFGSQQNSYVGYHEIAAYGVPEPSTWAMVGAGGLLMLCGRFRRS